MALDKFGSLNVTTEGTVACYNAAVFNLSSATSATDILNLKGSDTMRVRLRRIRISGLQTTAGMVHMQIIKRSTANSGGTTTAMTAVSHDSRDPAATAVCVGYTANPTLGTAVGYLDAFDVNIPAATGAIPEDRYTWEPAPNVKSIVLNSSAESVSINLNATTVTGGVFDILVVWTEEPLN